MPEVATIIQDPLAQNLRRLIATNKISEAELSRRTRIPQPTLHKILSGKTSDPRASTVRALAEFFKISIDELVLGIETKRGAAITHSIPVISWSESVAAEEFVKGLIPSSWDKWIVTEPLPENCFAVLGKYSMEPRFPVGTALIIDPNLTPEDGDIVLAHYANTNECTLRELSIDGPSTMLTNLYGDLTPQPKTPDTLLKGVLIRSIFSFHS